MEWAEFWSARRGVRKEIVKATGNPYGHLFDELPVDHELLHDVPYVNHGFPTETLDQATGHSMHYPASVQVHWFKRGSGRQVTNTRRVT